MLGSRYAGPPQPHGMGPEPVVHYDQEMVFRNRYDDVPPGTEPPPPGFENAPLDRFSRERESWSVPMSQPDVQEPVEYSGRHPMDEPIPPYDDHMHHNHMHQRQQSPLDNRDHRPLSESRRPISRDRGSDEKIHDKRSSRRSSKSPVQMLPSSHHHRDDRVRHKESSKVSSRDQTKESAIVHDKHHGEREKISRSGEHRRTGDPEKERNSTSNRERHRDRTVDRKEIREREHRDHHDREAKREKERERGEKERERGEKERERSEKERERSEKEKEKEKEREKEKEKEDREKEKERKQRDSSEERRERRTKEKKKKRKEEKALEKKKKKERKEKERRDKEMRKEQERARKLLEARIETTVGEEDYEQKAEEAVTALKRHAEPEDQQEPKPILETAVITECDTTKPTSDDSEDSEDDDEDEGHNTADDSAVQPQSTTPPQPADQEDELDLYGDIIDDTVINDYNEMAANEVANIAKREEIAAPVSPRIMLLNRSDSILDIHANLDFDQEIDELEPELLKKTIANDDDFHAFPEPSKWERDEDISTSEKISGGSDTSPYNEDKSGKVTNEVLKRAENAIFAKAINAIRPIEIKKISVERQKLYANDKNHIHDDSSLSSLIIRTVSSPVESNETHQTFQITVPVNSNDLTERSVELKTEHRSPERSRTKTPVRSVKDRLGSKVRDLPRSQTRTPPRKIIEKTVVNERVSRDRPPRDSKTAEEKSRDDSRRTGRDGKRSTEQSSKRPTDKERDRDTEKDQRDKRDVRTDIGRNRERGDREKSRDRHTRKSPPPNARDRDKERERARELARARERERAKAYGNQNNGTNDNVKSNILADVPTSKTETNTAKRERTLSPDSKIKRGGDKRQHKDDKHYKDDVHRQPSKLSDPKGQQSSTSRSDRTDKTDRKRTHADEVVESDAKKRKSDAMVEAKASRSKEDIKTSKKMVASSSSSSDSDSSGSSSDSEDNKKRKKRSKHKKQKRSRRASSTESDGSSKKKKSKRKKSKKKKKTKK